MKRILALDGGGIRGVFSLEVLLRIETLLRIHYDSPHLTLADHFDFFAGTSTGAIISTCLCWGMDVQQITEMYVKFGREMFTPYPWYRPIKRMLVSRFDARPLSDMLLRIFSEDGQGKSPALLSTKRLKKLLMVVLRDHTTGSAWPITNNPIALFNDPSRPDCNLNIPLWKVIRASTAAPLYFDPEEIVLGGRSHLFVDGSITPYANPALIAALTAILPSYRLNWEPGPDKIRMVSLGTLRFSSAIPKKVRKLWLGYHAAKIPGALLEGTAWEQDYVCRAMGKCIYGESLDSELGDLIGMALPGREWFSYVRYNQSFRSEALEEILLKNPDLTRLDAVHAIPILREMGQAYAEQYVRIEHLV